MHPPFIPTKDYTPRVMAYHEAAHAAAAWHTRARVVIDVSLTPGNGEHGGLCRLGPPLLANPVAQTKADIFIRTAGRAAERKLLDREPEWTLNFDAGHDGSDAMQLARKLTSVEREARWLVASAYLEACEFISRPDVWPAVVALAEALLRLGRIDGTEANRLALSAIRKVQTLAPPRVAFSSR